jgi:RimJ/RimL family protein N-acetyltransferase
MQIDLKTCKLRPWRAGDEASLVLHANNRDIWLNLRDRFPHPYTSADAEAWIRFASSKEPTTNFAIDVDGDAVGGVGLLLHDDVERVAAEIGYWLGESFWNRGIMSAVVAAVTQYGFDRFSLTRIYALPNARNTASQRVLEKAGYAREGVLRRSAIKDGTILDQVLFAITDEDFNRRGS